MSRGGARSVAGIGAVGETERAGAQVPSSGCGSGTSSGGRRVGGEAGPFCRLEGGLPGRPCASRTPPSPPPRAPAQTLGQSRALVPEARTCARPQAFSANARSEWRSLRRRPGSLPPPALTAVAVVAASSLWSAPAWRSPAADSSARPLESLRAQRSAPAQRTLGVRKDTNHHDLVVSYLPELEVSHLENVKQNLIEVGTRFIKLKSHPVR
ncbi:PREDICTED: uncharacterized protein LOC106148253 [Chinchilla lanigera]|uniref:uncharacterized protein LOC106148253 n=1 Tax=Chinchilla lanigera TaxID=34839 RepID=UPI0006974195|nr:PREDICTED: uncharacterized protein LOC106148253 [Chinchilla lanigera]